ncbi:MAG: hypothetical protein K2M11_04210 [Paramuribaculum sp.]|nr:hypothetical protein [Paramuribaculum sp.]
MKRFLYNTIALLPIVFGLVLASCADNVVIDEPDSGIKVGEDGTFSVTATLNIQRMPSITSRAMADTPSGDLTVKALEFSWNEDLANSTLTNVYDVELVSPTTGVANTAEVTVKLTLQATTDPTILQFIVTDADLGTINYGSMASILQSLWVSKNEETGAYPEAYFGQLTFSNGYGTLTTVNNGDGTSSSKFTPFADLNDRLKAVPLVRNFAKISCTESIANFELTGFALVNVPTAGTVAPWDPNGNRLIDMIKDGKMIPYAELPEGYVGMLAPSSQFEDTEADVRNGAELVFSTDPRYTYAHPYEPVRRTYMIVRGRYNGGTDTYYKIDLGYTDEVTHLFTYYNIIRNYHYKVTINSVTRAGYPTVLDAINGSVFNNLSASTETRDMLSLSDGENMIGVNMTRAVITNTDPVRFAYNYKTGVGSGAGTTDNGKVTAIGLDPVADVGPDKVLAAIAGPVTVGDSVVYTLTPNPPTDITKQQTFTVVDPNGLGRTITLVSRIPWTMSDIDVFGQALNERPDDKVETDSVGAASGEPLTLFFNLPDGIPESVFPLKFVIESNRQNIENNTAEGSTLVVTTAPSMFSATNDPRVAYIKTVTYEQYLYMPDEHNQIDVEGAKNPNHTVRCRFRTTIGLSNIPGEPNEMLTRLKIANPYFEIGEVSFVRKKGQ